jgi:ATP-dependent DNA helicase PIF1
METLIPLPSPISSIHPRHYCSRCNTMKPETTEHFGRFKNGKWKDLCLQCNHTEKISKAAKRARQPLADVDSNALNAPLTTLPTNTQKRQKRTQTHNANASVNHRHIAPAIITADPTFAVRQQQRNIRERLNRHRGRHGEPLVPTPITDYGSTAILSQTPEFHPLTPPVTPEDFQRVIDFHEALREHNMEFCERCHEEWFNMDIEEIDGASVCGTCRVRDNPAKRNPGEPYLFSIENHTWTGPQPDELRALTYMEEAILALAHCMMQMWKYRGLQDHYTGHVVTYPQNILEVAKTLPTLPAESPIVLIKPYKANGDIQWTRQFSKQLRVRRAVVLRALEWLIAHHPDYANITIDMDRLNQLPVDGDVSHNLMTISGEQEQEMADGGMLLGDGRCIGEDQERGIEDEAAAAAAAQFDDLPPSFHQSTVPNIDSNTTELEMIRDRVNTFRNRATFLQNSRTTQLTTPPPTPPPGGLPSNFIPMMEAPHWDVHPINELNRDKRIFAMCFPSLFPTGIGDWNQGRIRKITLTEWARHLLKLRGGRFAKHPKFRFMAFNQIQRNQARDCGKLYLNQHKDQSDLTLEGLHDILADGPTNDSVSRGVCRVGNKIVGTRPYWRSKAAHLKAQCRYHKDQSAVFLTWSCADHQWEDLHRHMPNYDAWLLGTEAERYAIVAKNIHENPHIIAAWLDIRFQEWFKTVTTPQLGVVDYWYRYEWQARGTGHIHCIVWLDNTTPGENGCAPKMGAKTEAERDIFAAYWHDKIRAWHPNADRDPDVRNPCSLPFVQIDNTQDQLAALLNRVQMHRKCSEGTCLRINKTTKKLECRFWFGRDTHVFASVSKDINGKCYMFDGARNNDRLNNFIPATSLGWLANHDAQAMCTYSGLEAYVSKYAAKPEQRSKSYKEIASEVCFASVY